MNPPINHISHSCINLFTLCPWCWYEKYVNKTPEPECKAYSDGKKYHEQVDNYHKEKPFKKALIKEYIDKYPVKYRRESETRFTSHLDMWGWRSRLPIYGIIDGIGNGYVCDLKFSVTKPETRKSFQGILYSMFYFRIHQEIPEFHFNWVNKKNKKVKTLTTKYTKDDFLWAMAKIDKFTEDISKGEEWIKSFRGKPYFWNHYKQCPNKV